MLGEARKIGSAGFGQQTRLAVAFHRMIMPDGYSVDLDQFHGLDQIGEEGLKDQVNNHYLEIFGSSIALGVITGAAHYPRRRRLWRFRAAGLHQRRRFVCGAVRDDNYGSLYADSANDHHTRGTSREGLFHTGHAFTCL
jgi:Bacterial conjugation TrbI-like protein